MRIALLAAASILLAGSAIAQTSGISHFGLNQVLRDSSALQLGLVRAAADGEVVVYLADGDALGRRIGSTRVHAGANPDVLVDVGGAPITDVIAVLRVNGEAVTSQEFRVARSSGPQ